MISVEPALFSNIIITVQRTNSLSGGSVSGLPNGVVIEGLKGVSSFGSDISEAQKEYELGRIRSALDRIRQIETQFNGIAGRWTAQVNQVVSSARQGRQQLSIQKLNEVKNAQTKMQQLVGPASKSFQDLVCALEHAVSSEGRESTQDSAESTSTVTDATTTTNSTPASEPSGSNQDSSNESKTEGVQDARCTEEVVAAPDADLLGSYISNYRFGDMLVVKKGEDKVSRLVPRLEKNKFYFACGFEPPRVFRVRDIQRGKVILYDTILGEDVLLDSSELKTQIRHGIWSLRPKNS
tara:strand:- start:153 stop:1037 length:885 start_codon:yes stop_codon:yes gene_type:complete